MPEPIQDEHELLVRARSLAGRSLSTLAPLVGLKVPADLRGDKGFIGRLVERCLGVGGNEDGPDFAALGIELKTLPIRNGRPVESTFVATLDPSEPHALLWASSPVRQKLARVLWVPIDGARDVPLGERRIGVAALWSPSAEEERVLRADFDTIVELICEGFADQVTAHTGEALQLRPKGANARALRWTLGDDGEAVRTAPRAFYLRRTFTESLVQKVWRTG